LRAFECLLRPASPPASGRRARSPIIQQLDAEALETKPTEADNDFFDSIDHKLTCPKGRQNGR